MLTIRSLALAFGLLTLGLTGCTHVAAYERGKLAHRTMTTEATGPAAEHVYSVHEGAAGGSASAESGCGCN